ncbi:MAG TPA: YHS domain-containing (seleno)protein [Xanthobacteraceae bacterium]|nr:YHS domain-containing (seleno)protein [Xanthobacteraceae bacterium]
MRISPAFAETMTTARRKRKHSCSAAIGAVAALTVYGCLIVTLIVGPPLPRAAAGEHVVMDWHSGLAIDGYDPVGFFTEGRPVAGSDDYELRYGGAVWRFANLGNRAAFAADPDVYMPQYGGYDPVGIARGLAVAGNPNVWLIIGEKLFLFYSDDRREKFAAHPNRVTDAADRQWPAVARTLTP